MIEFDTEDQMQSYFNNLFDKILDEITYKILVVLKENIINQAYVNERQSGEIGDLFSREYVSYYNGTGTPTFEFYDSFRVVRNFVGDNMREIIYDSTTSSRGGHSVSKESLLGMLENGSNRNSGHFINDTLEWVTNNFRELVITECRKYGLEIK